MSRKKKFTSMNDYLETASIEVRPILEEIKKIIKETVPAAQETISYQIPAFKLDRPFIYFAAFKNHIGIYPPVKSDDDLAQTLLPYRGEKGNLKFPLDQPLPSDLIRQIVKALLQQYSI
jgi:uncharacterized protein YdhG (YjbR/CyaY superfamily)